MVKNFLALLVTILLVGTSSFYIEKKAHIHEFVESYELNYNDNIIYGLDVADEEVIIYKMNILNTNQDFFSVNRIENNSQITVKSLVMNENQDMYALISVNNINHIAYCNFSTEKLDIIHTIDNSALSFIAGYRNELDDIIILMKNSQYIYQYKFVDNELELLNTTYFAHNDMQIIHLSNGQIWGNTIEGDYYYITPESLHIPIFINDGSFISKNNGDVIKFDDGIAIRNIDSNMYYKLEFDEVLKQPKIYEPYLLLENNSSIENIFIDGIYIDELRSILTTTITEELNFVPMLFDGGHIIFDSVQKKIATEQGFALLYKYSYAVAFIFIAYLIITNIKKGIPVTIIIIFYAIIIIIVGKNILDYNLDIKLEASNDMTSFGYRLAMNSAIIASIDKENFKTAYEKEYISQNDILTYYEDLPQVNTLYYDSHIDEIKMFSSWIATKMYFYKNDTVYGAYNNALNMNLKYSLNQILYSTLMEVYDTQKDTTAYYTLDGVECTSVISPIFDETGELIGAVESIGDYNLEYYALRTYKESLIYPVIFGSITILGMICVSIYIGIRKISVVSNNAYNVTQGQFNRFTKINGINEMAKLNKTLEKVISNILNQKEDLDILQTKYTAFSPNALFNLYELGDYRDFKGLAIIINGNSDNTNEFEFFNDTLGEHISFLSNKQAYIEKMADFELKAFFANKDKCIDKYEDKITCNNENSNVIEICLEMLEQREKEIYCTVLVDELHMGIIGNEHRKLFKSISKYEKLSSGIGRFAQQYKVPLIITNMAMGLIPNFNSMYTTRKVAYMSVDSLGIVETLYEIICANTQDIARKKEYTLNIFEEGLDYFVKGEIELARKRFVKVYSENPDDRIVEEYIFQCDKRLKNNSSDYYLLRL